MSDMQRLLHAVAEAGHRVGKEVQVQVVEARKSYGYGYGVHAQVSR